MPTPEFVLRLREKIGHDPLWLTGVTAVVLREAGAGRQVLVVRRADTGDWTPVAGIVEPGEHPADAAEREVLEEAGISCRVVGLVDVGVTRPAAYPNGDRVQFVNHTFRCDYVAGEPHPGDDESTAAAWVALDDSRILERFRARIARAAAYDGSTVLVRGGHD